MRTNTKTANGSSTDGTDNLALHSLLLGMEEPAYVLDAFARIQLCGPAGARLFGGASPEECLNRDGFDCVGPSLADAGKTAMERLLTGAGSQFVEDPAGGPTQLRLTPIGDPTDPALPPTGAILIVRETFPGAIAVALRDSEERFRRAFSAAGHGMLMVGPDARIRECNQAFMTMITLDSPQQDPLPADTGQFIGTDMTALVFPGDIPVAMDLVRRLRRTVHDPATVRMRFLREDGTILPALVTAAIQRDRADGMPYLIIHVTDRTAEHRAETRLRHAKEEADKASRAKTRFLAAASHDLRQPLQALNMFVTALLTREDDPTKRGILQKIDRSAEALAGLLNTLLDISKLDAGLMRCEPRSMPVGPMIQRLAEEFVSVADHKGLDFRLVASTATAWSDPALVEIILRNFLGNAVRYTPKGSILLGVRRKGTQLSIDVVDTGPGIPADQQQLIFDDFHQVENPSREKGEGLGLGLAIVARVAGLLQADIQVSSTLGRGSCFSLILPVATDAAYDPAFEVMLSGSHTGAAEGLHVLLIDDDPAIREGLQLILEGWDCRVSPYDSISSLDTALVQPEVLTTPPDVIVADYRLDAMTTGVDAVHMIRERFNAAIPALLLTGDTAPQRLKEADASGLPMLHKPARADVLRSTISVLVADRWREEDTF